MYIFRAPTAEELPSVLEAWAGSFRSSRYAGCIPNDKYYGITYDCIAQLLNRGMQVTVLALDSRPEQTLGWIAHERDTQADQPVVHFVFCKAPFRRRGLARQLMDHVGAHKGSKFIYTFATSYSKYFQGGYHMPSVARRVKL